MNVLQGSIAGRTPLEPGYSCWPESETGRSGEDVIDEAVLGQTTTFGMMTMLARRDGP